MKKLLLFAIVILCCSTAKAQLHYKGSVNVEAGAGINDMSRWSPVVAAGYTLHPAWALYGRYTLAYGSQPGFDFKENNVELLLSVTPQYISSGLKRKILFNCAVGGVMKFQDFGGFAPTPITHRVNFGVAADAEMEWAFQTYWSFFGRATYRILLADERTRQELFYSAGVRMSLDIFKFVGRRRIVGRLLL